MLIFLHVWSPLVRLFGNDEHFIFVGIRAVMLILALQLEREYIRQRQREGIDAAQARGVYCGRFEKERPENYDSVLNRWQRGELSGRKAARLLNISHTTFQRWIKKDRIIEKTTL